MFCPVGSLLLICLSVDEAWDARVDDEMGYDGVRLQNKEPVSHSELDRRYDQVMEGGSSDPFADPQNNDPSKKSLFREEM